MIFDDDELVLLLGSLLLLLFASLLELSFAVWLSRDDEDKRTLFTATSLPIHTRAVLKTRDLGDLVRQWRVQEGLVITAKLNLAVVHNNDLVCIG